MIVMFVDDHVWRKTETKIPAVSFILNLLSIATWYSSSGKSNLMQHVVGYFEGFLPKNIPHIIDTVYLYTLHLMYIYLYYKKTHIVCI